jgi:hypothetical protein
MTLNGITFLWSFMKVGQFRKKIVQEHTNTATVNGPKDRFPFRKAAYTKSLQTAGMHVVGTNPTFITKKRNVLVLRTAEYRKHLPEFHTAIEKSVWHVPSSKYHSDVFTLCEMHVGFTGSGN